jgi:hypothetical protein
MIVVAIPDPRLDRDAYVGAHLMLDAINDFSFERLQAALAPSPTP